MREETSGGDPHEGIREFVLTKLAKLKSCEYYQIYSIYIYIYIHTSLLKIIEVDYSKFYN